MSVSDFISGGIPLLMCTDIGIPCGGPEESG